MGSPPWIARVAMDVRKLPLLELLTHVCVSYITANNKSKVSNIAQLLSMRSHYLKAIAVFSQLALINGL